MTILDLIHGYQPFQPPNFIPDSIEENLRDVFLPTSAAMKNGIVRRGVQLQGWTIENWLKSPEPIKSLATETLANLKQAYEEGFIELGASGYAHPILPLLSPDLIFAQIKLDIEVLEKYLGKPTWFWFPEGAVDQKSLEVLFENFPKLIAVIPDSSLSKRNFSGFVRIKHKTGGEQRVIVCNSLLKNLMTEAPYCERRFEYAPENIPWEAARRMAFDGEKFREILEILGGEFHVLARDWENKGSKDGLATVSGTEGKDVSGLMNLKAEFKFPSEITWVDAETTSINNIKPGSWEPDFPKNDPFLYWSPNREGMHWKQLNPEQKEWTEKWQALVDEYNQTFSEKIAEFGGIEKALSDPEMKNKIKSSLPALISCIPWHFLTKPEFVPDPGLAKQMWQRIVLPSKERLTT